MKKIIENSIKENYGTKEIFCSMNNLKYKDFASKMRTVLNRFKWLNNFLLPLGLELKIIHINTKENEQFKNDPPEG